MPNDEIISGTFSPLNPFKKNKWSLNGQRNVHKLQSYFSVTTNF